MKRIKTKKEGHVFLMALFQSGKSNLVHKGETIRLMIGGKKFDVKSIEGLLYYEEK